MNLKTTSRTKLDDAINICYKYVFESFDDKKPTFIDTINSLENDNSPYVHYYPYNLILKLTSNCNLRCKHCFFCSDPKLYNSDKDLSGDELLKHLQYFVEDVNILHCVITGGEIFTAPYFFKILEYLKSKNIIVELLTNATLITEETAERLSELLNHKTDCIQISLDGANGDINDAIRGNGVFEKVVENVKYLTRRGLNVHIAFTINSKNVNQLEEMYDLCKTLEVSQLNVGRFQLFDLSQKYLEADLDELFINLSTLIQKAWEDKAIKVKPRCLKVFDFLNYETGMKLLDEKLAKEHFDIPQDLYCRPRHEQFSLYANGNISLCYNCEIEDLCIGNLKEKSFDEIWANRFSHQIFQKRELKNMICKDCKYVALCKGGCPVTAYWKYGTMNAPDSCCKYAEKLIKETKH